MYGPIRARHARAVMGADVSVRRETGDVVTRPGGKHEADRRDEARSKSASAQDHVDECAPGASVAVGEGVDRPELCVSDCRLQSAGWSSPLT